jgi:DNA polymerase-3 subunit alpha
MSATSFVHLHVHSSFSLLESSLRVDALVERAKNFGMPAIAVTDTHNLFGAMEFYLEAKAQGVRPILGCEVRYAYEGLKTQIESTRANLSAHTRETTFRPKFHPLVLLCESLEGYRNLSKLLTESYLSLPEPQKGVPAVKAVVSLEGLKKFSSGLVCLSGGLKSEISYLILTGQEELALDRVREFEKAFPGRFYLECQAVDLPEVSLMNAKLLEWSERYGIPCVATTDAHYLGAEDAEAQEVLQCIETGRNLDLDRPTSLVPRDFRLKSEAEMLEFFQAYPEIVYATGKLAERLEVEFRFKDEAGRPIVHLPDFRPEGVSKDTPFDTLAYFRDQSRAGLQERFESHAFSVKRKRPDWETLKESYKVRLESELEMIARTGFAGYFLIVADFIGWAKKQGIPVGPGRGSGAGSLVAYALKITDVDPIEFQLLFERFINPERVSMPDFDVDFCQERRFEVIEYVERKYGKDCVCQIITYGKLQARAVLKDVGRVFGFSFAEMDQISKLLPDDLGITLDQALAKEERLRERLEQDSRARAVYTYSRQLEGLYRNAGIHAAGVIITEHPVVETCPLYMGKDRDVVTQFDKDSAEKVGLVKFDFLGLKTLTVIDQAVRLIRAQGVEFDLEAIPYQDAEAFRLIASGDTDGVFQVESSGMKDLCSRIIPTTLEDLTAINALYRPGPLGSGMVDDFINRKHGRASIEYLVPELESVLRETYGVILYQEQVMQIARDLAGYSLGQADLLRRAMGKKKPEEMAKQKQVFLEGARARGHAPEKMDAIFDLLAKFADYGFNKSHSAAYGIITYQTAFLKAHYPAEFMAALMTTEMGDTEKLSRYIADAKAHGISILPPDVNRSQRRFSVEISEGRKAIRFGLEAIKGVGSVAVDSCLEARQSGGDFKSVLDFVKRVSTRKANKKVLESLTLSGAFDPIAEVNRASLLASLEKLLEVASDEQEERELGQVSLFEQFSTDEVKLSTGALQNLYLQEPDFPRSKRLLLEKQVVGFFVSGHPMEGWQLLCEQWLGTHIEKLQSYQPPAHANEAPRGRYPGAPKKPEAKVGALLTE